MIVRTLFGLAVLTLNINKETNKQPKYIFIYRASWITLYVESCEDKLDDSVSLKHVYDKVPVFLEFFF